MKGKRAGRKTRITGVKDLGKGVYLLRPRGYDAAGKRIERERKVQAESIKAAHSMLLELEAEMRGEVPSLGPAPRASVHAPAKKLGDVATAWVEHRVTMKRRGGEPRLTPKTRERYANTVRVMIAPYLGEAPLDGLTRQLLEEWRDHLGEHYAGSTVNSALTLLRSILRDSDIRIADQVRALDTDDSRLTDDAPNLLEDEGQVVRFLEFIRDKEREHFALVGLLVTTGLRMSTALALRREDFEPERNVVTARRRLSAGEVIEGVKRSRSARDVVPLLDWVWKAVAEEWAKHNEKQRESGLAFPTAAGGYRARTLLFKPMNAAAKALGIPRLTPHGLRRTAALHYRLGSGSAVSMAIAGHLTEDMHRHYAPVRSAERAAAGRAVFGEIGGRLGGELGGSRAKPALPTLPDFPVGVVRH